MNLIKKPHYHGSGGIFATSLWQENHMQKCRHGQSLQANRTSFHLGFATLELCLMSTCSTRNKRHRWHVDQWFNTNGPKALASTIKINGGGR